MKRKSRTMKKVLSMFLSLMMFASLLFTGVISGPQNVKAASALTSSDFLKTNGTTIRKAYGNGDTVYLRGTNAGGWLVQEDWMNPTNAPDQKTMMNTLADRFGASTRDQLVATYEDNYWTTQDFDNCASMGMSVIRLPFTYMNLCDDNGNLKPDAFSRLDWFVSNCSSRGIYVILDMHGAFGSQNGMDHSGEINDGTQLWYNQDNKDKTLNLWAKVAEHYKGNPAVAAYDILNEPGIKAAATYSLQWDFYHEIYKTIRSKDSDHIIIMESCWDADNLPNPSKYGWTNVAYEYHYYPWNYISDAAGQASYTAGKVSDIANHNYGVPTFVGEFTCFDQEEAWKNTMSAYNQQGWHWTTWAYKVTGDSSWGIYNHNPQKVDIYNDSADTIRSKWSEVGTDKGRANSKIYNVVKAYLPGTVTLGSSSSESVTLYTDINYGGTAVSLEEGSYNLSALQSRGFKNDELSSVKVPAGYKVTLYWDDNFSGKTKELTSDTSYVGDDWNDRMSSVKVERNGSASSSVPSYSTTQLSDGKYYIQAVANDKFVCAEDGGNAPLTANRDSYSGAWETIIIENNNDGTVSLKAEANNKYICAVLDEQNQLLPRSDSKGTWENFQIYKVQDGEYGIRCVENGKYVKADLDNDGKLVATSDSIAGAWEVFRIVKTGDSSSAKPVVSNGEYYFTSIANGGVVCAENDGNDPLIANRSSCSGAWESLMLENNSDGTISLKSLANGKYICVVADEQNQLLARSNSVSTWEKFEIEKLKDGEYALKACANGKYVQADLDNGGKLVAASDSVSGAWEAFRITKTGESSGLTYDAEAGQPKAAFYLDEDYKGTAISLGIGEYDYSVMVAKGIQNDALSSVKVPDGYKVTLYKDAGFGGGAKVLLQDTSSLGSFNNLASSIVIEKVERVNFDNADTYITSIINNKVVCAENDGKDTIAANRDSCGGAWESIQIVTNDDGTVSLRSAANGKYVCVIADEKNQLVPRSENIGTWEKFIIERINHNEYALYSLANGKYVQANINDGGKLYADSETVAGAWEAFKITKIE